MLDLGLPTLVGLGPQFSSVCLCPVLQTFSQQSVTVNHDYNVLDILSSITHYLESSFEIVVVFGNNEGCGFLFDYQGML